MRIPSRWRRLRGDDRGSAVEAAILYPVVLALIFLAVQAGLVFYGRQVALSAAQIGADESAISGGSAGGAHEAASAWLATTGSFIRAPQVAVPTADGQLVTVEVSGTVPCLIPGVSDFVVTQEASAPVEQWTQP